MGETALTLAAAQGHTQIVRVLLMHEAAVNGKNQEGRTALMQAAEAGYLSVTRLLVANGAEVNTKDKAGKQH